MVRSKIRYELIVDDRTRRETFKKRRAGFFKKINELKTLCELDTCAIVINEDGTQSEVWPSPAVASQVVQRFMDLPSSSQTNHMVDLPGFLKQNLSRLSKNLDKETWKVQSLEKELLLAECLANEEAAMRNSNELVEMLRLLERKIAVVGRKIIDVAPSSSSRAAGARGRTSEPYHGKGKQPL